MDKQQEIERLTKQIREGSNEKARVVVDKLRDMGWLTDGSLTQSDLHGANLNFADLKEAVLVSVDLSEAVLGFADLAGAQLRLANLAAADLSEADLSGAELNSADLSRAILRGATLNGTNLHNTNLSEADLSGANLSRATLDDADLRNTNLSLANLNHAEFTGAICGNTIFGAVDSLSDAKGLESIRYDGPSIVDFRSLSRFGYLLPLAFLRGVGLPDNLIDFLPSLTEQATKSFTVLISYSHDDADFARRLHDRLQGEGIRCWLDEHEINPGDKIMYEVDQGIRIWDKVLLCCSEASLTSWWVDKEISIGLDKEEELTEHHGEEVRAIIPLDLDGYLFGDDEGEYKGVLKARNAANFKDWKDHDIFEREVQRVIKALRTDGGKLPPPEPKL